MYLRKSQNYSVCICVCILSLLKHLQLKEAIPQNAEAGLKFSEGPSATRASLMALGWARFAGGMRREGPDTELPMMDQKSNIPDQIQHKRQWLWGLTGKIQ